MASGHVRYQTDGTCTLSTTPVSSNYRNQLGGTFTYDASGDLTYDGTNTLTYDAEGRIATSTTSGSTTTYVYGADGQRIGKIQGGVETNYARGIDGSLLATYVGGTFNGYPQEMWVGGKHFGTVTVGTNGTQTSNFSLPNWLGSEVAHTNSVTGVPCAAYLSQPYGDSQTALFDCDTDDIHFTGKERDNESGLDYFGARYYGSSMGRSMSPDKPFADQHTKNPQSWNLYSYVRNNPLKLKDKTGTVAEIAVNGNNITITIPVYFTGPNADARAIQAYSAQMQSAWTGQFGQYNVTTTVRQETTLLGTDTNVVNIAPTASGRDTAVVGGYLMNFNPLPADGDPLYGYDLWSSGHETGHNMDLPDEYRDVNGQSLPYPGFENNIMGAVNGRPSEQDITDIINAPTNIRVGPNGQPSDPSVNPPPPPPPPPPPQGQQQ